LVCGSLLPHTKEAALTAVLAIDRFPFYLIFMKKTITNLIGLTKQELRDLAVSLGEKPFRGGQMFRWIYKEHVQSIDEMTNISAAFREVLKEHTAISPPAIEQKQVSAIDGTVKFLFRLEDGLKIESVLIPLNDVEEISEDMRRLTLCISTQVGCPADCKFCATGTMGFYRNLTVGEIIGQIIGAQRHAPRRISNIVYMGMGEPMLNYDNVMNSIDIIGDDEGIGISPRRITVSTVGYVKKIKQMADEERKAKLAISLHTLDDDLRTRIMPINRKHNTEELLESARYYWKKTRQRVTFEYIFFEGLNDTEKDIKLLKKLSGKVPCKLNIIPFHPIYLPENSEMKNTFRSPSRVALERFVERLRNECDFPVMLRSSSGIDIDGACGQLAVKEGKNQK
jgi:23S rRNA (adenine2503-C2)-methyltransferase